MSRSLFGQGDRPAKRSRRSKVTEMLKDHDLPCFSQQHIACGALCCLDNESLLFACWMPECEKHAEHMKLVGALLSRTSLLEEECPVMCTCNKVCFLSASCTRSFFQSLLGECCMSICPGLCHICGIDCGQLHQFIMLQALSFSLLA